jgi:hypothetical protein
MGQIIQADQISTPSHSAGTITLPPSLLTLGGRQYRTSTLTRLISADVTLAANTLYFVYVQIVSGIPALRISASAPSVYKISNPTAVLVSGFYSNGLSAFGTFIYDVSTTPRSEMVLGGANVIGSQSSVPTKGNGGSPVTDLFRWERNGKIIQTYHEYAHTTAGAAGGAGNYLLGLPFPISTIYSLNTDSYAGAGGFYDARSHIGKGHVTVGGTSDAMTILQPYAYSPAQARVWCFQTQPSVAGGGWGQNYYAFSNATMYWSYTTRYEAQGLSETPLKDL